MTAEVNQHHPTPPPAASSCRNPNKKTVSPAVSRCISRKPWGIICICQKTLSLQLFHPEFFQALPLAAAPGEPRSGMRPAGRGGSPGYPRCPGRCPGPDNSLCVSLIVFQWRGEPRWRGGRGAGWGREAAGDRGAESGRWKPSRGASAARRGPALPRKAEAWPAYGGTKATRPKGAVFVLLYFLGKLLSWLRRGGQAGREPA